MCLKISFGAVFPIIPEDANVMWSEEENDRPREDFQPLDTSFEQRFPDGSFEFFIGLRNGNVNWGKGYFVDLEETGRVFLKLGFISGFQNNKWHTELFMTDHTGFHSMACK